MTNDDRTGAFWERHNKLMQDPEHEARFNAELARIREVDAQVNANDDLRTALKAMAAWTRHRTILPREIRALLDAHPAPEIGPCLPSLGESCGNCHRCTAPVSDTRREDVAAEAAWRASQEVNGFAEDQWKHVPEPQRASWQHIARAVLAVLPAPPVVDEAEIRDLILQVDQESRWENIFPAEADLLAATIAARLRGATRG